MNEVILAITCFMLGAIFGVFVRGIGRILLSILLAGLFLIFIVSVFQITQSIPIITASVFSFLIAIKKVNSNGRNPRKS